MTAPAPDREQIEREWKEYGALLDDEQLLDEGPCLEILNAGAGHLKVSFAKDDAPQVERARRLITDMLRAGYAIFVEVDGQMVPVRAFDPATDEYLIDQVGALASAPAEEPVVEEKDGFVVTDRRRSSEEAPAPTTCACGKPARHRGRCKGKKAGVYSRMPMATSRATAVGRTAGG
jgi:hypothetical protein